MEYQFGVGTHKTAIGHTSPPDAIRIKLMAFDHKDPKVPFSQERPSRPHTVPIGINADGETGKGYELDMRKEEDEKHCLHILRWISNTRGAPGYVRDIAESQGYKLPSEVTASTFRTDLFNYDLARVVEFEKVRGDEDDEDENGLQDLRDVMLPTIALRDKLDKEEEEKQAVAGASQ